MNCIHYMHDKYFYERLEMALHDRDILRTMAFGIAGLSVVADSLSAIKYGKMRVTRDPTGLIVDFQNEGNKSTPQFGNNDDRVDQIAAGLVTSFMEKIRKHPTYRNATHTQSVLTITSNVVYGKATGNTPDGRRKGEPFGPGANPMHGRDSHGWLASCLSVAKLPYKDSQDGISYTVSIAPQKAHLSEDQLVDEAVKAFDVYFERGGFHMNLNVIDKETLEDAMKNPDKYPQLDDPRLGLCRELRSSDAGTAERRDQPHFPRPNLAGCSRCRPFSRLNPEVVTTSGSGFRPTPLMKTTSGTKWARSAIAIPMRPRRAMTGQGCESSSSSPAACSAARTATIRTPGISRTAPTCRSIMCCAASATSHPQSAAWAEA